MRSGDEVRLLAVPGCLQASSPETHLLRLCVELPRPGVRIDIYEGLGQLPHFDADLDHATPPGPVKAWRARVAACDGLIVAVPERVGVPGVLKNALDWLLGSSDVVGKPVAVLSTEHRNAHAHKSLALTLQTISARLVTLRPYIVPVPYHVAPGQIEPALHVPLQMMIDALARAARPSDSASLGLEQTAIIPAIRILRLVRELDDLNAADGTQSELPD